MWQAAMEGSSGYLKAIALLGLGQRILSWIAG
jgi:hypothetical protein